MLFTYIDDYEQFTERVKRYENVIYSEGKIEGKIEGEKESKLKIAKEMKADGEPTSKIMRYTGLTEQEIDNL
jgi:predicted transposase/invertase (TIGR01784 family)